MHYEKQNTMIVRLIICILLLLMASCGGGISDFKEDLGNNYFHDCRGVNSRITYCLPKEGDSVVIFSTVKEVKSNDEFITVMQKESIEERKYFLFAQLDLIAESFRLVDSLPIDKVTQISRQRVYENRSDSILFRNINERISSQNSEQDHQILFHIADSVFENDKKYAHIIDGQINYWIINKQNGIVYGPFDYQHYLDRSVQLGVSKRLQLQ